MNTTTFCSAIMMTLFAFAFPGAVAGPDTRIVNMECNAAQFTEGSHFAKALNISMDSLTKAEESKVFWSCLKHFFIQADCREELGAQDCAGCFSAVEYTINMMCKNNMGVQLTLQDCKIRYEAYPFDGMKGQQGKCPLGFGF